MRIFGLVAGLFLAFAAGTASAASFSLNAQNEQSQANPGSFVYDVVFQTEADEPEVIAANLRIEYINALDPTADVTAAFSFEANQDDNPFQFNVFNPEANSANPFLPQNRVDIGGAQAMGNPLPTVDASDGVLLGVLTVTVSEAGVYALNTDAGSTDSVDFEFNELNDTTASQLAYIQVPEPSALLLLAGSLLGISFLRRP